MVGWSFGEGARAAPSGSRGERRRLVDFILRSHTHLAIPVFQPLSVTFRIKARLFRVPNGAPNVADPPELSELSVIRSPLLQTPSHRLIFLGYPLLGPSFRFPCALSFPRPFSSPEPVDSQALVSMSPPFPGLPWPPLPPPAWVRRPFSRPSDPLNLPCHATAKSHLGRLLVFLHGSRGAGLSEGRGHASFILWSSAPSPCSANGRILFSSGPRIACSF